MDYFGYSVDYFGHPVAARTDPSASSLFFYLFILLLLLLFIRSIY